MPDSYFQRVRNQTSTRFWLNNPTSSEVELALAQGARGCTTNPAYGGGLLRRAPDEVLPVIAERVKAMPAADELEIADAVQEALVRRIVTAFRPLFEQTGGLEGFVSIQGSPESDHDGKRILAEAHSGRLLGPNATPKIPATAPGFEAMAALVREGSPVIVTEVFSVAQLHYACDVYESATAETGLRPPFFMSPITGILGDHLRNVARREGVDASARAMELAGVALSRRCHREVVERGSNVTLLAGGARITDDFLGLVGGGMNATINWSTAAEILALDPPVHETIDDELPAGLLEELLDKFEDFRRAWSRDALGLDEFEAFGPVQTFRNNFLAGWTAVRSAIRDELDKVPAEVAP